MEVPMFDSIGISEWVAASISVWLVAQLPLGMLVGYYLRRATVLSTVEVAPVYPQRNMAWQLLQGPAGRAL